MFEYSNCNMSLAVVKMEKVEPDSYEGEEGGEGEGDAEEGQGAAKGEGEGDYYVQPHDQPEKTYLLFAGYYFSFFSHKALIKLEEEVTI